MTGSASRYDLVVIGAGPAGLLSAYEAGQLGAKVALIERDRLGGNCLHTGCVPSKTLIRTSRLYADMRDAAQYGAKRPADVDVDFSAAMERVRHVRARLAREVSPGSLETLPVDLFSGTARFVGRDAVAVGGDILRFEKALIATGARPTVPSIPGLTAAGFETHETLFELTERPDRLVVVGGGPTGCELSQAMSRLGSMVTIVQIEPMFLGREERDAAQILSQAFERDGIEIHLNTDTIGVRLDGKRKLVDLVREGTKATVVADCIFVGVGETPNVDGLNLEAAEVEYDAKTGIPVNDFLETTNSNIYAAGDVSARRRFTHFEPASSRIVVHNALGSARERVSALTIPWCTYTDPEIAHVGLYVREARQKNIPIKTFTVLMHDVHRAICDGEEDGFVKIHVREGSGTILGATVVARHAGEMINDISLAIQAGIDLTALGRVIRPYPTQAAAIQMAADAFRSATGPNDVDRSA